MVAGVVTLGRQRYAVGLYWENSPGSGRVAQIAKEAANQPGQQAEFYAVRSGGKSGRPPQFGLCSSEAGQKAGMPTLAGCLANQVPGSWAGAFRLNEGIVVVIVRDDLIVPDGDLYFLDESEARDRLIQEIGFGGLLTTYAPEAWSIPGADTIPLSLLLNDRSDVKLQQVRLPKNVKMAVGIIALVFVIVLGGAWYWQEKVAEEEALRLQQEEAVRRAQDAARSLLPAALQNTPPAPKYDRKWEESPTAMDAINACRQKLQNVPAGVAGWKLTTLKCTGATMSLSWTRDKGPSAPPPGSIVGDTGGTATTSINLGILTPRGSESLLDSDDITKRYLIQNWPGSISRAPDDPPPLPPPGYTGPWNPPPAPWVKRSFTFTVAELPSGLPEWIGDLPGVVINNMSHSSSGASSSWNIEGVIYENRK